MNRNIVVTGASVDVWGYPLSRHCAMTAGTKYSAKGKEPSNHDK